MTSTAVAPDIARAVAPPRGLLGRVALGDAQRRARGCSNPVRLIGGTRTHAVDRATGELGPVLASYSSADELDGYTYVRCGDRRAERCESCSHEYKGDAWHLLVAGLTGGKDVPPEVATHPALFATFTAPSFGVVHGRGRRGPCRARRDHPVCPHGRPLTCYRRHDEDDHWLGQPLCADCYDYTGHVLWQWHLPELWRRFRIRVDRTLAADAGIRRSEFRHHARLAYSKVGEFQARGLIHFHVLLRLDGPTGPDSHSSLGVDTDGLADAIRRSAQATTYTVDIPGQPHHGYRLTWGDQLDIRPIHTTAGRDDDQGDIHPETVAAYTAKYLTKSTEDFGLNGRVCSAQHAARQGASEHVVRIIETAERLVTDGGEPYERLAANYATLGYRGHPITKTRRYSTTFTALRTARARHRSGRPADARDDAYTIHEALRTADPDDPAPLVTFRAWQFAGCGYLALDSAERALISASNAREYRHEHTAAQT